MNTMGFRLSLWLIVLFLLGWLFHQSSRIDVSQHLQVVQLLEQLRKQDARLNQYILQSETGQLRNYDPIVITTRETEELLNALETALPVNLGKAAAPVAMSFNRYRESVRDKFLRTEQFKSHNAVLHNSLRYFPLTVTQMLHGKSLSASDELLLRGLLEDVFVFIQNGGETFRNETTNKLDLILIARKEDGWLVNLLGHVRNILSYNSEVKELVDGLTHHQSAALSDELFDEYAKAYTEADHIASHYKLAMWLLASIILAYVAWIFSRLQLAKRSLSQSLHELEFQKYALDQHSIVSIADRSGKITYSNDKFSEISKFSRDELLGQDHRILNSGHHPHEFFKDMWQTIGKGKVWQGEILNRAKDDSQYWVNSTIVPFMDDNGKPIRYVSIRSDITKRKHDDRAMLELNESLESRVQERTVELNRAIVMATAANQAKSTFLANMSHEIRTPMNAILGFAYLLQKEVTDARQQDKLAKIAGSAAHLLSLINDILDLSKIEADSLEMEVTSLNIRAILDHSLSMMSDRASGKALQLIEEIDPVLVAMSLLGDPLRIRQILINYASNAIKFTEKGHVTLRAKLEGTQEDQVRIRFEVEDTGIGIPVEAQARIFDAFEQAEAGTTRKYGGTGLGLAIAKRFAHLMGGEAGVVSQPGQGSTFWFTASLRRGTTDQVAMEVSDTGVRAGAHVLLVEDNEINQEVAKAILEDAGLVVEIANHGGEAVEKAQRTAYDLVLMDMQMPVMDGLEATRRIRAMGKTMPILALTANAFQQDKENCKEAGMNDFITKPVDPGRLYTILAKWIPG